MAPSINMPQQLHPNVEGIAGIVNAFSNISKNNSQKALTDQETQAKTLANAQAQKALDTQAAQTTALKDPNSPESAAFKRGLIGSIGLGQQAFPVKDPNAQSALHDTITSLQDPSVSGWQAKQMADASPLISSLKDFGDKQIQANAMAAAAKMRSEPQYARLDEQKNQNSIEAGNAFEHDPIIKLSKTNLNSLTKSQSILSNPSKPVTTKDLNLAYNDYINSVAAGGTATEGKISRELPETWATEFNTLKGKAGQFDDLRQSPTGQALISQLNQNISTVRHDMASAISDQAGNLYDNYGSSTNQKVQDIAKQKLKTYAPDKYAQKFGGPVQKQGYTTDPSTPSNQSNNDIHPDLQNLSIKQLQDMKASMGKQSGK